MQGLVAASHSPSIMENSVFRQQLGLSLTRSVLQGNSGNACGGTARCLFGAPEPKQCKDLVRTVELKSALAFGKRFNFDVISGEPFPSAKKMKLSHESSSDESDQENANVKSRLEEEEKHNNEGYNWSETYTEDYMAMCNKHAVNTSIVGPSRHAAVSLLYAPIIQHSNQAKSFKSSKSTTATIPKESPVTSTTTSESSPCDVTTASPAFPLEEVSPPERNNNKVTVKNSQSVCKRRNRINSSSHISHHHPQSAKKSSHSKAHQIITKYYRVVKHPVVIKNHKSPNSKDTPRAII